MLNRKQIRAYREHGFLVLRAFISGDEIDRLCKAVDRMVATAPVKRTMVTARFKRINRFP